MSSSSFHISLLYTSFVPCRGLAVAMKLLLDFNLDGTLEWWNSGWRGSDSCLAFSSPVAAFLRISGGATPIRGYSFPVGVGLRHPVTIRAVSFTAMLTCFE